MMQAWFADTYYFLALRNPKDEGHAKAVAATAKLAPRKLVTTSWVLTEVADALAKPANRPGFARLIEMLAAFPDAMVLPPTQALFDEGVTLFNARADKEWSLTDCVSFVVMTQLGITEALTGDHHFEQAGFVALLK
jgi:predicted nucleic acid-binding protein